MINRRLAVLAVMALCASTGCSVAADKDADASASPTAAASASAAPCTEESAVAAQQVIIRDDAFDKTCVRAEADKQFFLVNGDGHRHVLLTQEGAPMAIDATLAQENSTYAPNLPAGRYDITCSVHDETLTVFVVATAAPAATES